MASVRELVLNGKITFTPKSVVDRHIAEGLDDLAHGRTHGPYKTADAAIAALEARARKPKSPHGESEIIAP